MWNKNISIFSRGLAGVPASHFPHKRLSGRGERQLCPSQPSGTGTVWALGSCFYQSHGCPCAEHWASWWPSTQPWICQSTQRLLLPARTLFHWIAQGQWGQIQTNPCTNTRPGCGRTVLQKHPWLLQSWWTQLSSQPLLMRERMETTPTGCSPGSGSSDFRVQGGITQGTQFLSKFL